MTTTDSKSSTVNLTLESGNNTLKEIFMNESFRSLASGGFGGMCLVLVGHPFDLIKVRLQTSSKYTSTWHAFKSIIKQDGIKGYYRGMTTPFVGITPIFAICFWGYDMGQRIVFKWKDIMHHYTENKSKSYNIYSNSESVLSHDKNLLSLSAIAFAGGFSALPTTLIMTPAERIKVMLQIQDSSPTTTGSVKYTGPIHVAKSIIKSDSGLGRGILKLYQGTLATLARDIPGSMAYFVVYEGMKRYLSKHIYHSPSFTKSTSPETIDNSNSSKSSPSLPVFAILLAGGLAGMVNWCVSIPADVIKSRIQAAPIGSPHLSGLSILRSLLVSEGPTALFKGLGPALLRAFPANAACFLGVELSLKLMKSI